MKSIDGLRETYQGLTSISHEVDLTGLQELLTISFAGVEFSLELRLKHQVRTLGPCNKPLFDESRMLEVSQRLYEEINLIVWKPSD
jgi:hypothetical protein